MPLPSPGFIPQLPGYNPFAYPGAVGYGARLRSAPPPATADDGTSDLSSPPATPDQRATADATLPGSDTSSSMAAALATPASYSGGNGIGPPPSDAMAKALLQNEEEIPLNRPFEAIGKLGALWGAQHAQEDFQKKSWERSQMPAKALSDALATIPPGTPTAEYRQKMAQALINIGGRFGNPEMVSQGAQMMTPPPPEFKEIGRDVYGQPTYGWVNPMTQQVTPTGTQGTGSGGAAPSVENEKAGDVYKSLPKEEQGVVDGLLDGRIPLPSSRALGTPLWSRRLAAANDKALADGDPTGFDALKWQSRLGANHDFKFGKTADAITAGNTAIGHLNDLDAKVDKLNNWGGIPFVSYYANRLKNEAIAGTPEGVSLSEFDSIKQKYEQEITKFYRGSGGSEADIQEGMRLVDSAKSLPELHAAVHEQANLIRSKVDALQNRWHSAMGDKAADFPVITPSSQKALEEIEQRYKSATGGSSGAKDEAGPIIPEGTIQEGEGGVKYRSKGGHRYDRNNWEPVTPPPSAPPAAPAAPIAPPAPVAQPPILTPPANRKIQSPMWNNQGA